MALAGPPKSAKNWGVRLFKTVRLIGRIRYSIYWRCLMEELFIIKNKMDVQLQAEFHNSPLPHS